MCCLHLIDCCLNIGREQGLSIAFCLLASVNNVLHACRHPCSRPFHPQGCKDSTAQPQALATHPRATPNPRTRVSSLVGATPHRWEINQPAASLRCRSCVACMHLMQMLVARIGLYPVGTVCLALDLLCSLIHVAVVGQAPEVHLQHYFLHNICICGEAFLTCNECLC